MLSRVVCFVCGSTGGICQLRIHARESGPYFPFLETHDPPKGARLPGNNGVVDSCRVCFAFLNQQWESYEKNKTPSVKRLYWLKRVDNGMFTGAEMRLQGEYAAQVMGLQYQPSGSGTLSPYEYAGMVSNTSNSSPGSTRKGLISPGGSSFLSSRPNFTNDESQNAGDSDGALDLSVPASNENSLSTFENTTQLKTNSSKEKVLQPEASPRLVEGPTMVCYICSRKYPSSLGRFIYAKKHTNDEPYFPFLMYTPSPKEAMPLTKHGLTRACSNCRKTLCRQWRFFDSNNVPEDQRVYQIDDKPLPFQPNAARNTQNATANIQPSKVEHIPYGDDICYLCAQGVQKGSGKLLNTRQPDNQSNHSMFFPFLVHHRYPCGAKPIDCEGRMITCRACYSYLQRQWQQYQCEEVPIPERKFVLRPLNGSTQAVPPSVTLAPPRSQATGSAVSTPAQPLNIEISSQSSVSTRHIPRSSMTCSPAVFSPNASGLLAIATPHQPQLLMPGVSYLYPQLSGSLAAPIMSEKIAPGSEFAGKSALSEKPRTEQNEKKMKGIDERTFDRTSKQVKKCVVCGTKSERLTSLRAHPLKQEPGEKSGTGPTWPFFPFLTNPAYGGLSSIAKDGTVTSCFPCFHSLHQQWTVFEESSNIEEQNRWLRKYKTKSFICYTCGKDTKRQNLCEVYLNDFPFIPDLLRELPRLRTAVYVEKEGMLLTCSGCQARLRSHHEQMKRDQCFEKKHKGGSTEEGASTSSESLRSSSADVSSGDERNSNTPAMGIPAGSKPPPLTMVNSITRTTATVPPLNQTSPSSSISVSSNVALNATRASSFAAALRKLAKQAGDPDPHESGPESLSVTSTSPRDPGKRGSAGPPLPVYPPRDQGTSSISSPPVVTIAPTPAHPGFLNSDNVRKSLERPGTNSSHGNMMIDPLGIKQEGERRPTPHERREEDRPRSKDSASQRLPAHSVMSNMAVTSVVGSHEDHLARGFQPYRPGEDSLGRSPYPSHYPGLDPMYSAAAAAAAYHSAFQPAAHAYSHPAFRFDDPLLLERYRLMQASPLGLPYTHPGMFPPPGLHPLLQGGSRYPPDVLPSQHMPFLSSANHISPAHSVERQKSEDDIRREREKEVEKERERERQRERERERELELERQREKEREAKEREERERRDQEAREERQERERQEREKASRCKRVHQEPRYNSGYPPNPRDSVYSAEKLIGSSPHQSSEPLNLNKRDNDRHKQSNVDRERERQYMHSQFLREQENRLREQERHNSDKREHYRDSKTNAALSLTIPKVPSLEMGSHPRVSESHSFHRPFERTLTNGYERDHFTDYERRLMTERILAQDRKVLPAESHGRVSSGSGKPEHQDSIRDSVLVSSMADKPHLHEGIQSRLLESEKPKLKPVHGAVRSLNRYDYDRPQPEFNFQLKQNSGEHERLDNHRSQPECPPAPQPQSQHLSKLDLEEMRLRRARANGEYNSDVSEEEEGEEEEVDPDEDKRQRLMVIPAGLPSKLDTSPKKMKFLAQFGLTSQEKCSDVVFEKQCKRRRLYHEPSVSPTEVEVGKEVRPSQPSPLTTHINPDDLNRSPDYKAKTRFLYCLGLEPVPVERRQYWDMIRQICDWDKRRRLGVKEPPPPLQPLENHIYTNKSLAKPSIQGHISPHKRKYSDMEGVHSRSPSRSISDSPKITLGQLAARHSSQPQAKSSNLAKMESRHMGHSEGQKEDRHSAFNREFAQEFHESVLQTTRQQQEKNAPQPQERRYRLGKSDVSIVSSDVKSSKRHVSPPISSHSVPICVRSNSIQPAPAPLIEGSKSHPETEALRWPGIEAVMEAYQKHAEEQKLEKQILLDQCQSLQYQNRELNRSAERLSMCMSDLLQKKQHAEEDRLRRQTSIDNLKKCLKFLR